MSNQPNQPAEDAPEPESAEAAGQAEPQTPKADAPKADLTADGTTGPAPAAAGSTAGATPAPADPATATPAAAAPAAATPGAAAPAGEPSRYLTTPDDEGHEEPARSGSPLRKILIAALAVIVIVGGFFAVRYFMSNSAAASAGDCVSLTEQSDNRADVKTLDCGDAKASYQVGKVLDQADAVCPEEGLYTEVSPASSVGDGYKLCLLPNMAEGACYKPDEGTGFVKGDCTGPDAIKVTKVIKDSTDLTQCPDSAGMSYPEPAVTYCLAPAEL
ncbi:hypothetical protein FHS29_003139 [Saccharothrix tamanrassetensis]|uniref:Uncharacterized protein n=1 Tax=Saccharothrix tamanrassetensis TaxID=1051531 RepID=A0A841CHU5_9PSEU|nr:hypothetical protein [Saccharothrix tamanrassetensis]MBB5956553.1 hypothetical protein [Saccharothrix tamanrassetensis]